MLKVSVITQIVAKVKATAQMDAKYSNQLGGMKKSVITNTGFPQTFDNWIQDCFKDFQGQQQFSRI